VSPDRFYNPDLDLYLGLDKGFRNPNVTLWLQPDRKWERVLVLYAHYQWLRTPDENARIALAIHRERGYGSLTAGWGDPSAPDMLRAYSLTFGREGLISGPRRPVEWGEEVLNQWLKTSRVTQGRMGLVFAPDCTRKFYAPNDRKKEQPISLVLEIQHKEKHEPGKGMHHGPDGLRYFYGGWEGA